MYDLKIINRETGTEFEFEIEDLDYLIGVLKQFDETKIDFELHNDNQKVKRIEKWTNLER